MNRSRKINGWMVFSATAFVVLWMFMFGIYSFFAKRILVREEENMVMGAQTVANSMQVIANEQENLLNVYFNRNHIKLMEDKIDVNIEAMLRNSNEQTKNLTTDFIYVSAEKAEQLNFDGALPYELFSSMKQQNQILGRAKTSDQAGIAGWKQSSAGSYTLYLVKAVLVQERCDGYIFEGISLNEIYNIAMSEVAIGAKTDYKIMDENSVVMLHTRPDWVGINMLQSLGELPEEDREKTRRMIQQEISGKTGYSINRARWLDEPDWGSEPKIEVYTPIEIGSKQFFLVLSAPRSDVMGDVNQMMVLLMGLFFAFLLTAGIVIYKGRVRAHSEQHIRAQLTVERALNEANRKLQQRDAQDVKQDRLQTLGLLAGSMAHELNNAMTPIVIYSDLLLDGYPEDDEIQEYALRIRESAQRCGELVHNVLNYGRQEKEEFKRQFYDVVPIFHATASMLKQVKPDNVDIQAVCEVDVAHLYGNEGAFQQAVVNLAMNAFYAMRECGGVLRLRLSKGEPSKIMLEVDDTGEGMPPEVMKHIFEPFYTTKPEGEGTGLGLAIVKRLVERQNGAITVEGDPGLGTRFRIILPQYEFTGAPMNDADIQEISERHLRIYLLDDEFSVVRALYQSLARTRWKINGQTNPVRAYAELHDRLEEWDLLITDSVMPEMNGLELAELLRARRPELKILLITGYDDNQPEEYVERGIIDGFLYKPVQTKLLLRKIAEIIDSKKFTKNS